MVLLTLWILETCILLAIAAHHLYWTWMSLPSNPGNLHLEPAQRSKCPSVWVADLQAPSGRWDCHCWYWGWQAANAVSCMWSCWQWVTPGTAENGCAWEKSRSSDCSKGSSLLSKQCKPLVVLGCRWVQLGSIFTYHSKKGIQAFLGTFASIGKTTGCT